MDPTLPLLPSLKLVGEEDLYIAQLSLSIQDMGEEDRINQDLAIQQIQTRRMMLQETFKDELKISFQENETVSIEREHTLAMLQSENQVLVKLKSYYQDKLNQLGQYLRPKIEIISDNDNTYKIKRDWIDSLIEEFGWVVERHLLTILNKNFAVFPVNYQLAQRICRGYPEGYDYTSLLIEIAYIHQVNIDPNFIGAQYRYVRTLVQNNVLFDGNYLPLCKNRQDEIQLFRKIAQKGVDWNVEQYDTYLSLDPHWRETIKGLYPTVDFEMDDLMMTMRQLDFTPLPNAKHRKFDQEYQKSYSKRQFSEE